MTNITKKSTNKDTANPVKKDWKGQMRSEIFPGSDSPTCVRFWFYMKAVSSNTELGTLNVIRYNYDSKTNNTLWTIRYGQGSNWLEGRFSYISSTSHSIIFEGIKGNNLGDIAIDDIAFYPSSNCSTKDFSVQTEPPTIPTTTRSTTTYSWIYNGQYDCNFENGYCIWSQTLGSNFN